MHQNIAVCLLASQSINQSASQPEQPSFFVKAYTCYIKEVACPRAGGIPLISSSYVWSGPASTVHPKKYQEFQVAPKIFEILATPKIIPHYVP